MAPVQSRAVTLAGGQEVGKFAFVIHPLHFGMLRRLKPVKIASRFLPQRLLENLIAHVQPFAVGSIKNVVSATGAKAEGIIYAVPMTSKAIMRFPPEFLYQRLQLIAHLAKERGAGVMGLGAFTSVVGDAGLTLSKRSPIGITSGNSFTVAATMKTLREAAERCGIDVAKSYGLVIGATGSIGSVCARLLAAEVDEIALVAPRPEKLLELSRQIEQENPRLRGRVQISRRVEDFLGLADLVVATTSALEPVIDVSSLKSGAVVCDVARPPDIKEAAAARRSDILVIESGEILLPEGAVLNYDIGLPPGTIYACLAETLLLGLEQRYGHYTLGREIDPQRVREIEAIGEKHGLRLAPIRSFGKEVPEEHFARMRAVNSSPQPVDKV
jgi:predicted amino acid dehydrogenase